MSIKNKVIAIACADLHLSHKPPIWRSTEPDWYEAMKRPLDEISQLQLKYACPILCAGDIFDKWDSPAELINFVIEYLPDRMFSIAGQHDLPNHNLSEINKSAYYTLQQADKISDFRAIGSSAFNYGEKLKATKDSILDEISVAIAHQYVWSGKNTCYKTASSKERLFNVIKKSDYIKDKAFGYDIIIFGDNHVGFKRYGISGKTIIINCGSLMRLHKDQIDYKPRVWLIYKNGGVEPYYLDISKDKYLEVENSISSIKSDFTLENFAKELKKLGTSILDFEKTLDAYFLKNKTNPEIQKIIKENMK